MMTNVFIHPGRVTPKRRPLKAWRHMQKLIANKEDTEQVFHIIESLNGNALMRNFQDFVATPAGQAELARRDRLPERLDDHSWIRKLPAGSVGQAYVAFMEREGLTAQGLVEESEKMSGSLRDFDDDIAWYGNRLRDTHDLFHVLSGYGRDALGEASLLAFSHGQTPGLGILFISYVGTREIRKSVPKDANIMACFHEGRRNGAAAQKIVEQDILALLAEPLDAARARLNISEPVAYKHALRVCADHGFEASQIQLAA